ncbi:glycoside hydrolase domain-containing protein [Actinocatenispora sera]|uniref:glycoside hydrolase domain-containing protein n=1 Tax=Actinocatenispora sera TaxID=390989 RepID=UPI0033D6EE5C
MKTTMRILASLAVVAVAETAALTVGSAPQRALAASPAPGSFTGQGFDACSAPSSTAMQAWAASPYRAVGVYVGGINRACSQPNLTAGWVAEQQAAGWHLVPIYMGLQAPCTTSNKKYLIDPATAAAQGRAAGDDAVAAATALGLPRGSTLYDDMEAYRTGDSACRTAVLNFVSGFDTRVHDRGYLAGLYGSMASTVADQVAAYSSTSLVRPDHLDFARWDGVATVSDSAIPSSYWSPHRRIKQYRGGHDETWGGVTINIDNDYLDVAPIPATKVGDFTGNGWSDLLGRNGSNSTLYLYPGNGTNLESRTSLGAGWGPMNSINRLGDFTGDGREDVIARDTNTGYLWLYPGTGTGLGARVRLGTGWNAMREIAAVGDLTGDGRPDLAAVQTSSGYLYLYPGRGTSLGARTSLGAGWNAMSELTGVGDFNRDGRPDLIARLSSSGDLYLYPGRSSGFAPRARIGTGGWNSMRSLDGIGDFNRDGYPDMMAIHSSSGYLYLYPGRGTGFASRIRLGTGWGSLGPLS